MTWRFGNWYQPKPAFLIQPVSFPIAQLPNRLIAQLPNRQLPRLPMRGPEDGGDPVRRATIRTMKNEDKIFNFRDSDSSWVAKPERVEGRHRPEGQAHIRGASIRVAV